MIHADYVLDGDDKYYFTDSEWKSLVNTGTVSASISIFCNVLVLGLQGLMFLYRRPASNRLTLRLITLSCFCNMMYCSLEITSISIKSTNNSCRALVYLIVSFDTMSSMSLTMVGLNLVMIFIFKIYRSWKAEATYYFLLVLSGLLVALIPLRFGHEKGKSHLEDATCWYHFYFEDRFDNVFNWMWYYGWLMLSLVFAAASAILSIQYVVKNQRNLAGVLNMFAQREREDLAQGFHRYNPSNTKVFLKIARRCVCYPLVPLFTKIWGVAIAIASSKNRDIPFGIFIADRVFTCLFGFLVACIYFSDPAIKNVIKETINSIKQTYVYDYCSIKYQPGLSPDGKVINEKHLQKLQVISIDKNLELAMEYIKNIKRYNIEDQQNLSNEPPPAHLQHPLETSETTHSAITILDPPRVELEILCGERIDSSLQAHQRDRCCSVMTLTCMDGRTVIPKDSISPTTKPGRNTFCFKSNHDKNKNNVYSVPMKRLSHVAGANLIVKNNDQTPSIPENKYTCHAEFVDTMVAFKHPKRAKILHWCLMSIFRVKINTHKVKPEVLENKPNQRVFRDFTDSSNPQTPNLDCALSQASAHIDTCSNNTVLCSKFPEDGEEEERRELEYEANAVVPTDLSDIPMKINKAITLDENSYPFDSPGETSTIDSINLYADTNKRPSHHRSLSVNIASLNRQKLKVDSPSASTKSKINTTTTQKLVASFGLRRLFDKTLISPTGAEKSPYFSESSSISTRSENEEYSDNDDAREPQSSIQSVESVSVMERHVNSPTIINEFKFAVELSPRPLTQYQNLPRKSNKKEEEENHTNNSKTNNKSSKLKMSGVHDTSNFGVLPNKNIPKRHSAPEPSKTYNSSFTDISTSLNYISNWQFDDSKERIGVKFEHWDLEQQLQDQMKNSKVKNNQPFT